MTLHHRTSESPSFGSSGDRGAGAILVINQVAGPLMDQLLTDLDAAGFRCRLLTGWLDRPPGRQPNFQVLRAPPLVKAPAWRRLWSWSAFTARSLVEAATSRLPLLVSTNPPWVLLAMPLLRRFLRIPYSLLIYDVYPEVAERMGFLRPGGRLAGLWRRMSRRAMLRADAVITIGSRMAETLRGHLRAEDEVRITVIPNWADTDRVRPRAKSGNPFAAEHGLADKLVVMYSGSFGATHDVESIVGAAEELAALPDVRFVLIGGGTRQGEVERLVAEKALPNLTLLPFQPWERLPYSLAAADCAIVCLDEGCEGVSVPSKTYYALAAGAALLAVSPPDTELTDLVWEHGCGIHVPPRSPDGLAEAVRRFRNDPQFLSDCRRRARRAAEEHFSRRRVVQQYIACLRTMSAGGSR